MTDPQRYARIKELFIEVIDLPADQRESAIRERCGGDEQIIREVVSLLDYESEETLTRRKQRQTAGQMRAATLSLGNSVHGFVRQSVVPSFLGAIREKWFKWFAWSLGIQAVLLGLTYFGWHLTNLRTEGLVRENLAISMRFQSKAVTRWLDDRLADAEVIQQNPDFVNAVSRLIEIARQSPGEPLAIGTLGQSETQVIKKLFGMYVPEQPTSTESIDSDVSFGITNEYGILLLASRNRDGAMQITQTARAILARVFGGETIIVPPKPTGEAVPGFDTEVDQPLVWIAVPVSQPDSKVIAALSLIIRVDRELSNILDAGQSHPLINTYLFNELGETISDVRRHGKMPDTPPGRRLTLRDPGINLLNASRLPDDLETRPLTAMVRTTIARRDAFELNCYRDCRGVEVIGAGQWIDRYGIGLASEMDRERWLKATSPWKWLTFMQLFGLGLTAGGLVVRRLLAASPFRSARLNKIGDYPILRKIGEGGMGVVYLCAHPRLRRRCAVKVLRADQANAETRARMEREAQLSSSLNHAHTVQIYDMGITADGLPYLVMEYVQGETIWQATEFGPMTCNRALRIWKQVVSAVADAHEKRILHRDIKPQNIMLCQRGGETDFAKLLDFGLVKDMEARLDDLTTISVGWLGTPRYMAPERMGNPKLVDVRSDIYGLGIVAYRMLAGRDPYEPKIGESMFTIGSNQIPPNPSKFGSEDIPKAFEELVMQCLNRNPEQRPPDCRSILSRIEQMEGS
ncbi:MAG: serine/threonine-protein kinase [Pirellula sp.]